MPSCDVCDNPIPDWSGNVMVDSAKLYDTEPGEISSVEVWCKDCTREKDRAHKYHAIFELSWMRDRPLFVLGSVMTDLSTPDCTRWSASAVSDLWTLAAEANPALAERVGP